jgi:hypothetical protein
MIVPHASVTPSRPPSTPVAIAPELLPDEGFSIGAEDGVLEGSVVDEETPALDAVLEVVVCNVVGGELIDELDEISLRETSDFLRKKRSPLIVY